jgi:hypothetical protein
METRRSAATPSRMRPARGDRFESPGGHGTCRRYLQLAGTCGAQCVRLRQLHGAFQHAPIQVGRDQPLAKRLQRALRKRRVLGAQAAQDHLHPQIDDRQLDHLGVGNPQVPLNERRHGHHRGRTRLFSRARGAVHGSQLVLQRIVEQLMPMEPQKPEELPDSIQTFQQKLLLPRRGDRRRPARDHHLPASSGRRPTSASDHRSHTRMHRKN